MKIFPLYIPPNYLAVPLEYYLTKFKGNDLELEEYQKEIIADNFKKTQDEKLFDVTKSGTSSNFVNFHKDIKTISYRSMKHCLDNSLFKEVDGYAIQSYNDNYYYRYGIYTLLAGAHRICYSISEKNEYFKDRPWIELAVKKYKSEFANLAPLSIEEIEYYNGERNFNDPNYDNRLVSYSLYEKSLRENTPLTDDDTIKLSSYDLEYGPPLISDYLFLRLFVYLTNKYYGKCSFNIKSCKSERQFYYFEFLDNTVSQYKAARNNPLINYEDDFYFRAKKLVLNKEIIIPVIYNTLRTETNRPKYKNKLSKYDLLLLPKKTEFVYLNYNTKYKLILGYINPLTLDRPIISNDATGKQQDFFFYIPMDYCDVSFYQIISSEIKYYKISDNIFNKPEFYITHNLVDGRLQGITRSDIFNVIKDSGLDVNKDNFPMNYSLTQTSNRHMKNLKFQLRQGQILWDIFRSIDYAFMVRIFSEYYQSNILKKKEVLIRSINKIKQLQSDTESNRPEWQKICAYIGGNYKLKQLQEIANTQFSVQTQHLGKLSKRALCVLLAQYSVSGHKTLINNWLRREVRKNKTYPVPENICTNYADTPDIYSNASEVMKKIYNRQTTSLTNSEYDIIRTFVLEKLEVSAEELATLDSRNIAGWKQILKQWQSTITSFREMQSEKFVVIVKPNLVANCISIDTIIKARESTLCTWNLRKSRTGVALVEDPDGNNFIPNRNEPIVPIPFHDDQLEQELGNVGHMAVGSTNMILLFNEDYNRMLNHIDEETKRGDKKLLIFYLGNPIVSRTGNCEGSRGVSKTHGQLHSEKAIYNIVYRRRVHRSVYVEPEDTSTTQPRENPEIRRQLDEIKELETRIIIRREELAPLLQNAKTSYQYNSRDPHTGEEIEILDFIRQYFPNQVDEYMEDIDLERQLRREVVMTRMRLQPRLYS